MRKLSQDAKIVAATVVAFGALTAYGIGLTSYQSGHFSLVTHPPAAQVTTLKSIHRPITPSKTTENGETQKKHQSGIPDWMIPVYALSSVGVFTALSKLRRR